MEGTNQEAQALLERLAQPDDLEAMAAQGWAGAELAAVYLAIARHEGTLTPRQEALETYLASKGHKSFWPPYEGWAPPAGWDSGS